MKIVKQVLGNRVLLFAIAAICLFLALIVSDYLNNRSLTIRGTFILHDNSLVFEDGAPCHGNGGYDDIQNGTQVTVSDGAGKKIAVSSLTDGRMKGASDCVFTYVLNDVPRIDIYQLEIAHRGELTYSYKDLEGKDFALHTTLGE